MKLKIDWFLAGLGAAIALAWLVPGPGAQGGWLHPEILTKLAVALIFFLHGARLSFAALRAGALNWRLHLLVQLATFVFFPLLGVGLFVLLHGRIADDLNLGLFFLCALPSTISSAIILTGVAKGDVAGAVFNATISNLIGVILTPLWITGEMRTTGHALPLGPVVLDLVRWLVVPLLVGQVMRRWLGGWLSRHRSQTTVVDRGAILLIVYTAFCDSFRNGVWSNYSLGQLGFVLLICLVLFAVVISLLGVVTRALGFARGDRIAAMFCGSKKTLAAGVPMAKLIFEGHPGLGLILLPVMLYHPLQLVICGVLAQRWSREAADEAEQA
ncbi:MAG TPA: bile acid:sodium symporter family protein [Opitutaceae bacterium]|nr:bile acid:sodium symporter family protein [Opitutaceae bacterium]